ncbi:ABC transporter substrate-binding protein [Agarivorans sp. Toyoura001]|uniref:ABC transporter substrate-binding protein n=1 Tax=Agarivorans sp. Toyoura001 TaxID=2283141 RepID=UPI0010D55831|nr:ABC transporter substrate-binding protein [Agarivorans sp. Toyoura001]GDY26347.1 ABC transporter substrate-binding protein [Agarivorans sp. Toyoura001]
MRIILLFLCCFINASWAEDYSPWLKEFRPSSLSQQQQIEELAWFKQAAKPFQGITIRAISERINTHWYEATVIAPLFYQLTGIKVIHELSSEDDVVKKLQSQMDLGINYYDIYVSDSDLIGGHFRSNKVLSLSEFMREQGKQVTLPSLDVNDFIGLAFTTSPYNEILQLPDQQFANLYWYRQDWFARPELQQQFKAIYGYPLAVPVNWSAYEDIAEFFSKHVKQIDGHKVYGHMDYGKRDPSLGWRISDAWLSMAGMGDVGLPNGLPVDEWGIRRHGCRPVGASVKRGGALDSPAAIYAIQKYVDWLVRYAPPEAQKMTFSEAGAEIAKGHIAQQIFWYTAFTADLSHPDLSITDDNGKPLWRVAPSPRGAYWQPGMKSGYQDVGAWTLLKSTPLKRQQAAWLYAQFNVAKTVSLRKTMVGLTPIRESDIMSPEFTQRSEELGGLVEFYQSNARNEWTPTGLNVPNYPALSALWWQYIGRASDQKEDVSKIMQELAKSMDAALAKISHETRGACSPKLISSQDEALWLAHPGSPKPKLENEKPPGKTLAYSELIKQWQP